MSVVDLDRYIARLKKCEFLREDEIRTVCMMAKEVIVHEDNVQKVDAPVTIVGDLHGHFFDLLEIFNIGGEIPYTNYIFLGNYVDRGHFSVETIELLITLKARYPDRITLLRGNHECRQLSQVYGFYDECLRKYGSNKVWKYCTELFDCLSLGAVVEEKMFCIHSGLSPEIHTLDQIRQIPRLQEIPRVGGMFDLLWSEPDPEAEGYMVHPDGLGYVFGGDVVHKFRELNKLDFIVRSHSMVMEGYRTLFPQRLAKGQQPVATLTTVWSAPNYCYRVGNLAAILEVNDLMEQKFKVFQDAPQDGKNYLQPSPKPDYVPPQWETEDQS